MALISQFSRISHHTVALSATTSFSGKTFTVPGSEDFTLGGWTIYDLALSEIGVDEFRNKAYIRIGNNINEFNFGTGGTSTTIIQQFTGNTSASCISDLYVSNIYGCSPLTIHDSIQSVGSTASGLLSTALGSGTQAIGDYSHAEGSGTHSGAYAYLVSGYSGNNIVLNPSYGNVTSQFTSSTVFTYDLNGVLGQVLNFSAASYNNITSATTVAVSGTVITTAPYYILPNPRETGIYNPLNADQIFGLYSHAEGLNTQAIGNISHSEGEITQAIGYASHAEGYNTQANGVTSHAEGNRTIALDYSHAEGLLTQALNDYSHAEGHSSIASGAGSHAQNFFTVASGQFSHAEGRSSRATGFTSHAEGFFTVAANSHSHAEGEYTIARGITSHAEGSGTTAIGNYSHSEGQLTIASGNTSHAEGLSTQANGIASHSEGQLTKAIGDYSHAEGNDTDAIGIGSHAEGNRTSATGDYSHAEGDGSSANQNYSHAEGTSTADGEYSHSEGESTTATGTASHAEGGSTNTFGDYSHAEGYRTTANGLQSHAEGTKSVANGDHSHAGGFDSDALNYGEFARSSSNSDSDKYGQHGIFTMYGSSTSSSSVGMSFGDGTTDILLIDNSAYRFDIKGVAISDTGALASFDGSVTLKIESGLITFCPSGSSKTINSVCGNMTGATITLQTNLSGTTLNGRYLSSVSNNTTLNATFNYTQVYKP